jgi:hemoglobin
MSTIFERYGGFAKISRIVSSFYDRVLDSPILEPYFSEVDMRRLIDHQTKFMAQAMGGPASYTNQQLEKVHSHLQITSDAFDEMHVLLRETLEDFGVERDDVEAVIDEIVTRRSLIVTKR